MLTKPLVERGRVSTSVVRAVRILETLAHHPDPMTLAEIVAVLRIPRSTAYTILQDLVNEGFLASSAPAAYTIGLKAFEVGSAHLRATGTVGIVAPQLARLTRRLNLTSHFAVLDGTDAVYLCKEDPPGLGVKLASSIGARLPSHLTAVGKACLASLDGDQVSEHVALKTTDIRGRTTTITHLTGELEQVRLRGWASDDAQTAAGIQCIASPIFDRGGPKGAIGVSFLVASADLFGSIAGEVFESASTITSLLGGDRSA
jgi:DNA-binding IclR family transcriptional regulator